MSQDFERLCVALRDELELWKPSEQNYDISLSKAKLFAGLEDIRLSQAEKNALHGIYQTTMLEEMKSK